jgi:hypothetical protein
MMQKMGFNNKWIDLVMECVRTVSYSVLVNGELHGLIKPSRNLRQGDPLSPYLFLIYAEGLHALIAQAAQARDIHGVSLCRRGPKITHLFFADDSLLFCKATSEECNKIQNILSSYERASSQQLNRAKTILFFSSNTCKEQEEELKNLLGVPAIRQYEKYLGLFLPSWVDPKKFVLLILRKGCGKSFKVGRKNFYLKLEKKFLLKQWSKQSQPIQWVVSNYPRAFVRILKQ